MPTLTTLVSFNGTDGQTLFGGLIADASGDLYGTTSQGGANGGGTVFEIVKTGGSYASTPTELASFDTSTARLAPADALIADAAGDLFGTTVGGGTDNNGTVFELVNNGSGSYTPTTLDSFIGNISASYDQQSGDLIADAAGDLFGTTTGGGADGFGTVFELVNNGGGSYTPTTLVTFDDTDGFSPSVRLIADAAGDLFGEAGGGDANGDGIVFEIIKTDGSYASTPTPLASFDITDGQYPDGGLIMDAAGDLFGTTVSGGADGDGTVFEVPYINGSYASTPTLLASFNGTDGQKPEAVLIADAAGDLFGTTVSGGENGDGTVFEITKTGGSYASTPTVLASFSSLNGSFAGLLADAAGDLFGTTENGGANGDGSVFELTDTGFRLTPPQPPVLSNGGNSVTYTPAGAAVAIDGGLGVSDTSSATLAGATVSIGAGFLAGDTLNCTNPGGLAVSYNSATGVLTLTGSASVAAYQAALESVTFSSTLVDPSNSGADPSRTVSWSVTDGALSSNTITSTVDVRTPQVPTLITLVSFNGTDGQDPEAGVIADAAGNLLGTTYLGGPNGQGTVFEIVKTDSSYASTPTTLLYGAFGKLLSAGLIANAAGDFFGTTSSGGTNDDGTAFAFTVTPDLTADETTLVSFNQANINSTEGINPDAGLILDAFGNLFGTTVGGGANNDGTVYELPFVNGSYAVTPTTLVSFNGADGSNPQADLIADAAGDLFGTTPQGGTNGGGTVFEIAKTGGSYASTPTILASFTPTNGPGVAAGLIMDAAADLFGTTYAGGVNGYGSVFEIAKTGNGYANTPTTLASFNGTDGATPEAGLIIDSAGDLFGTTSGGGNFSEGTVFEIAKTGGSYAGTPTTLVSFNVGNGDGGYPAAALFADAAGNLFGTTEQGGANFDGTVFEVTGSGFLAAPAAVTATVQTASGINLGWGTLYDELANSPIAAGGTATQFTLADTGAFNGDNARIKFVIAGAGFTYSGSFPAIQLTAGTITGLQEEDTSNNVLATFTGFSISATAFNAAMNTYMAGGANPNPSGLNAVFLALPYNVTGGAGSDNLQGGNVANTFYASTGDDTIDGGAGTNTADYSTLSSTGLVAIIQGAGGTVNKDAGNGVDTLTGVQDLVDTGTGRTSGDVFYVDAIENVTASSSNFNYLIELSAGVNLAYGTNLTGISEFVSNVGTNTVSFAADPNFAYLFGSTGNDTLTLGSGGGYMFGEGGTNVLTGGANATNLFVGGDGGSDTMNGGTGGASNFYFVDGNDQVNGAGAFNTMIELVSGVTVQLDSAQYQDVQEFVANSGTNAVTVANTDSDFVYLYGGAGNDTLTTGSGGGYLFGEGGTNVLTGGGGLNVFVADGASGVDTMNGGSGSNIYYIDNNSIVHGAGTFNTVIELQQNATLTLGSAQLGTDVQQVILNGGTNTADFSSATSSVYLYGGAGNDTLFGGTGNDFLYGGTGTNTFEFQTGWGQDTIEDWTAGTNDQIDLTALSGLGVHALTDLTQTITSGNDVITSSHTGTNSITVLGVGSALTASSFHFA